MNKIIINISDDLTRRICSKFFTDDNFEVIEEKNGKNAMVLIEKETPDIVLADVFSEEIGGLDLLKTLKEKEITKKIPIIIFSQNEREGDRQKAMELEAKDFIVGVFNSPAEILLKVKSHLGIERTYQLTMNKGEEKTRELARDLGYDSNLLCSKCNTLLQLFLIRDLNKGKNYFKVSFICPKCLTRA